MALTLMGMLQTVVERVDVFPVTLADDWQTEMHRLQEFFRRWVQKRRIKTGLSMSFVGCLSNCQAYFRLPTHLQGPRYSLPARNCLLDAMSVKAVLAP